MLSKNRTKLRRQTAKLIADSGGEDAFVAMLKLFRDSIERTQALQALLHAAECRAFSAYAAIEAGLADET